MKTVCITGASSGFGKGCAIRFGSEGWKLILLARRKDRLDQIANDLGKQVPVFVNALDVRSWDDVTHVFENLPKEFKEIDVLINNAGLALGLEPAHEIDINDWDTMVDTNIKGLMYCTRAVLPMMIDRNHGHIINVGSVAGNWPYPGGNVYGATKAFVHQFSQNLRCDLIGKNIRVSVVEPGLSETEFSIVRFKGNIQKAAQVYQGTQPLTATDIAEIIFWIANLPSHVNINRIEVMPTCQAWAPFAIHRS